MKPLRKDPRPTIRKAENRGFEPVRWRSDEGAFNGWIEKRGRKYLICYFTSIGQKKLPLEEERHMTSIRRSA